ncbi:DNA-3-methyladenine glycosylase 2 family protein [Candidatus Thorarchaeota archaeon]|nr:MAG: DNA-3-methyladenine glycosylase 2 family protein [Candidatus Thorarchaeota archaeon]
MITKIEVPKRYDLLSSVHAWIYPDVQPVPEQTSETGIHRLSLFCDECIPIMITQNEIGSSLIVEFSSQKAEEKEVKSVLVQMLGLDVDMKGALRELRMDGQLNHISIGVAGIQPFQSPSVFEALVKTIIQQQVSYRAANVLTKRMILSIGPKMSYNDHTVYGFPSPEEIARCTLEQLQSFGFGYKAEYIHGIAHSVVNGNLELEGLRGKHHSEVSSILQPIHGIGLWTIKTLAIAGLGDFTTFPTSDLGIRNILGRLFNDSERMSEKEIEVLTTRWGDEWPLVLYLIMCADVLGLFGEDGRQQSHKRQSRK